MSHDGSAAVSLAVEALSPKTSTARRATSVGLTAVMSVAAAIGMTRIGAEAAAGKVESASVGDTEPAAESPLRAAASDDGRPCCVMAPVSGDIVGAHCTDSADGRMQAASRMVASADVENFLIIPPWLPRHRHR